MNDQYEPWPTLDGSALLGGMTQTPNPAGKVDPYDLMLKKKQAAATETPAPVQKWPEADVKALEEYCARMGITGFNNGRIPPIAALAMLKQQFGEDFSGVPLEERVPAGYEKLGTRPTYNPRNTYSQAMSKKQILHG